jgi:hypothetical protein
MIKSFLLGNIHKNEREPRLALGGGFYAEISIEPNNNDSFITYTSKVLQIVSVILSSSQHLFNIAAV